MTCCHCRAIHYRKVIQHTIFFSKANTKAVLLQANFFFQFRQSQASTQLPATSKSYKTLYQLTQEEPTVIQPSQCAGRLPSREGLRHGDLSHLLFLPLPAATTLTWEQQALLQLGTQATWKPWIVNAKYEQYIIHGPLMGRDNSCCFLLTYILDVEHSNRKV